MKINLVAVILCGLLLSVSAADEFEEPEFQLINLFAPMVIGRGHFARGAKSLITIRNLGSFSGQDDA